MARSASEVPTLKPYLQSYINSEGKSPIYIRFTFRGKPDSFSTKLFIQPERFNKQNGVALGKYPESREINNNLKAWLDGIQTVVDSLVRNRIEPIYQNVKHVFDTKVTEYLNDLERRPKVIKNCLADLKEIDNKLEQLLQERKEAIEILKEEEFTFPEKEHLLTINPELLKYFNIQISETNNNNTPEFFNVYNRFITDIETGKKRIKGKKYSNDSIRQYRSFKNVLEDFQKTTGIELKFENINDQLYYDFKEYALYKRVIADSRVGVNDNQFANYIKYFKAFLNYCHSDIKVISEKLYSKNWEKPQYETNLFALKPDDILAIYEFPIKSEHLQKVRDSFVFQCLTTQRFKNIKQTTNNNIIKDGDDYYIQFSAVKTSDFVKFKLPEIAVEILKKYSTGNSVLPNVFTSKYNKHLKEIAILFKTYIEENKLQIQEKKYNLTQWSDAFYKVEKKDGKVTLVPYDIEELFASHCARRTGITTMLLQGMTPVEVMNISNHSDSRTFQRYIKFSADILSNRTNEVWKKVFRRI